METVLSCDVCIIGGNIAGSYLAYKLAKNNVSVIVVEQNRQPGVPMQCAGIVSQHLSHIVDIDPTIIINQVNTAWLILENGKKVSVSIKDNPYILDRVKLDQFFYRKALKAGALFLLHERFESFRKTTDFVKISTNKRKITTKIIVGCDGPNSKVAKLHGVAHNLIPAAQVRAFYDHASNSVEMYFRDQWKYLFGWVIPIGNGQCRIGLGCKDHLKKNFVQFLTKLRVDTSQIQEKYGGQILLGYPKQIAFDRAILLGDAAGMVKASTGGGINTLLKATTYATKAILNAIRRNNFSRRFLITHYKHSRGIRHLKHNILLHYLIRIIMKNMTQKDYELCFSLLKHHKTRILLVKYGDMDFPMKFIIKMALKVDLWVPIIKIIYSLSKKLPNIMRDLIKSPIF
jgi:geranylgeranyl reductase family protein